MDNKVIMGFEFEDKNSYNMAKQELDRILRIKEKYTIKNTQTLLEFYNKLIDERIFKTPVGMEYLRELQKELYEKKDIEKNTIRNIPAIIYNEPKADSTRITQAVTENPKQIVTENPKNNTGKGKRAEKYKDLYIKMLIVNIVLVVTIIVMLVITKRAEKYDLDYYRESIENEYLNWEEDLKERESAFEQKKEEDK